MERVPFQTPSHRQQSPPTPLPVLQPPAGGFDLVSPSVLLIILILAAIFFVSGLFHLLVRLFLRPPNGRHPDEVESDVTALQGQLQQLFHLHDAGVDQSYIDTLPVFLYKSVIGVKDPFDCAVCLCELEPQDKLRLLPNCSHAFHVDCIDTWLLSHSTCPLCRAPLIPDSSSSCCAPVVCVLESGSDSSREMTLGGIVARESGEVGIPRKSCEVPVTESESVLNSGKKIVSVKLGKFRNVDGSGESSSNNVNSRRCFSMGSFAYVMDETTSLQVPIRTPSAKKQSSADKSGFPPLNPGHRSALSEYGSDSRREFDVRYEDRGGKGESFSISKIWFRSGEIGKEKGCSKRSSSSSFRFPFRPGGVGGGASVDDMMKGGNWSENGGSEMGWNDDETQSFESHQPMASTTRRTLLWLMSRQQNNKVNDFHPSSLSSNV